MQRAIRAELVIAQAASTTSGELMLSFRAWIGLGLICLGLVSCATMSPKECRVADWHEIGLTDGLAGKTMTFFNERRLDCEEAGVVANPNAYLAGREQGLQSYCDLRNAPQVGLRGESYEGVCPPDVDPEFRRRHRIGFDIYSFNVEIGRLQNRYDALEERLRRNRREFDKRLGLHDKKDDPQRLYRDFEREQARIRDEQRSILNALQWNQYQSRNAAALLEQLR